MKANYQNYLSSDEQKGKRRQVTKKIDSDFTSYSSSENSTQECKYLNIV